MNYTRKTGMLFILLMSFCSTVISQEFHKAPWLEDFAQLKKELAAHYANLDWAVEARGLDLKQLSERTETRLQQAGNEAEAKRILENFLDAFGDGHLVIQWKRPQGNSAAVKDTASVVPDLCTRLNFNSFTDRPRMTFTLLKNYREILNEDSKYFPIGVLDAGKNAVGILRIPVFSEYMYPGLCETAMRALQLTGSSSCDDACADRMGRTVANLLTAALVRQVEVLKRKKIHLLVIDITGNGGGTNWTEAAARTLTSTLLQSPRQQFIRHPHWTEQFKKRLEIIESDMTGSAPDHQQQLRVAISKLRTALSQSEQLCDRAGVWENGKLECSLVAEAPSLYPQSVLSYARPGTLPDQPSSRVLFYPSRYEYTEGVYSGKLAVLVDWGTWSSAEYFAAMLKDNGAATIIGQPTGGAGCGYTNGGIPTFLKNSGAQVKIPDCVRLRKDGSNEVEGITPDILIPWRPNDNNYQRLQRFQEALLKYLDTGATSNKMK